MAETYYAWDPEFDYIMEETDADGTVIAEYTHKPKLHGGLISQKRGSTTSYYHYDPVGTTRALTNQAQTVTDRTTYNAFGELLDSTGTTVNPFGFGGRVGFHTSVSTKDSNIQSGWYDPSIGKLLQTIETDAANPLAVYRQGIGALVRTLHQLNPGISASEVIAYALVDVTPNAAGNNFANLSCPTRARTATVMPTVGWDFSIANASKYPNDWENKPGPPCDGWIVQRVEYHCLVDVCDKSDPLIFNDQGRRSVTHHTEDFVYYEAWKFTKAGGVVSQTDTASHEVFGSTKGHCNQRNTQIRFYCEKYRPPGQSTVKEQIERWLTDSDHRFGLLPCAVRPGILYAKKFKEVSGKPGFWDHYPMSYKGIESSSEQSRSFCVEWDCCCEPDEISKAKSGFGQFVNADTDPTSTTCQAGVVKPK